ncbi:MAG: nickel pincer cofactor biosynthesis protein LarC [Actinomycetota bacterium]
MENILYIDCFSGISGDMMVGALLDLGLDYTEVEGELKKIGITGYRIEVRDVKANSLAAKKFTVKYSGQPSRNYRDIQKLFSASSLQPEVKKDCLDMFAVLAQAEAKAHNCPAAEVHFHEIGAVDSIIDIAAAAVCLHKLKPGKVWCSNIPLGRGYAGSMHGKIPVPAPATVEILKGLPVYQGPFDFEVTTPTGAAIIKRYARKFGDMPEGIILGSGMGAGSRISDKIPNILRVINFKRSGGKKEKDLRLLCTNIDDTSPEIIAYVTDKLLKEGALDVWVENILMKKGRPAFKLCAICPSRLEEELADIIFSQTTTLGIRSSSFKRHTLDRKVEKTILGYGEARIKLGIRDGRVVTAQPEYGSCARLAEKTGKPLKEVYEDVMKNYPGK